MYGKALRDGEFAGQRTLSQISEFWLETRITGCRPMLWDGAENVPAPPSNAERSIRAVLARRPEGELRNLLRIADDIHGRCDNHNEHHTLSIVEFLRAALADEQETAERLANRALHLMLLAAGGLEMYAEYLGRWQAFRDQPIRDRARAMGRDHEVVLSFGEIVQ